MPSLIKWFPHSLPVLFFSLSVVNTNMSWLTGNWCPKQTRLLKCYEFVAVCLSLLLFPSSWERCHDVTLISYHIIPHKKIFRIRKKETSHTLFDYLWTTLSFCVGSLPPLSHLFLLSAHLPLLSDPDQLNTVSSQWDTIFFVSFSNDLRAFYVLKKSKRSKL